MNMSVKRCLLAMLCGLSLAFSAAASAADVGISAVPTPWRLQNYLPSLVVVWHTGSPCTYGKMTLVTTSEAERNRFWALIMIAKLTNRAVFIFYESSTVASDECRINSFAMDG